MFVPDMMTGDGCASMMAFEFSTNLFGFNFGGGGDVEIFHLISNKSEKLILACFCH